MLTRRGVLTGAAAASIAAIATVHSRVAAAAGRESGPGFAFGNVDNGLSAGFHQDEASLNVFLKYEDLGVALFLKNVDAGGIDVFGKFFGKVLPFYKERAAFHKWMPLGSFASPGALAEADPSFGMVGLQGFEFFLKLKADPGQGIMTTFAIGENGSPEIAVNPIPPPEICRG